MEPGTTDLTKAWLLVITSQEDSEFEITQAAIDAGLAAPVTSFDTEQEANDAKDAWLAKPHPPAYTAAVIPNANAAPAPPPTA